MDTRTSMHTELLLAARTAHARRDWRASYDAFVQASEDVPLNTDDLDALAVAAWRLGRGRESVRAAERVFTQLVRTDPSSAAMKAVELGLAWINRGDLNVGHGWIGRAHRLLDTAPESPTHGYLAYLDATVAVFGRGSRRARTPSDDVARHLRPCRRTRSNGALPGGRGAGGDFRRQNDRSVRAARRGAAAGARRTGADRMGRRHLLHGRASLPSAGRSAAHAGLDAVHGALVRRFRRIGHLRRRLRCAPPAIADRNQRLPPARGPTGRVPAGRSRTSISGRPARATTNSARCAGFSAMADGAFAAFAQGSGAGHRSAAGRGVAALPAWAIADTAMDRSSARDWPGRTGSAGCGCCARPSRSRSPGSLDEAEQHLPRTRIRRRSFRAHRVFAPGRHTRAARSWCSAGEHAEALDALQSALRDYRVQQSRYETAQVYEWMALAHQALGDDELAAADAATAREYLRPARRRTGGDLRLAAAGRPDKARTRDPAARSPPVATNRQVAEQLSSSARRPSAGTWPTSTPSSAYRRAPRRWRGHTERTCCSKSASFAPLRATGLHGLPDARRIADAA